MNLTKLALATVAAASSFALSAIAANTELPPPSTQTGLTYAVNIKPIFDNSCVKCHHGDRAKAHLHLDSLAGVLKGAKHGKVIKPGHSADSVLIKAVSHATRDHHYWMPPLKNKAGIKPLTPEQIGLIRAWIDQGAK